MPIRWNAREVSEALDRVDEYIDQSAAYLEQAKIIAIEAREIPNLPGYVGDRFASLKWDIERSLERLRSDIASIRKAIPDGALRAEREKKRLL